MPWVMFCAVLSSSACAANAAQPQATDGQHAMHSGGGRHTDEGEVRKPGDGRSDTTSDVEQAFAAVAEAHTRLAAAIASERVASDMLHDTSLRYRHGEGGNAELLDAEAALLAASRRHHRAWEEVVVSHTKWLHAIVQRSGQSTAPLAATDHSDAIVCPADNETSPLARYYALHRYGVSLASERRHVNADSRVEHQPAAVTLPHPTMRGKS